MKREKFIKNCCYSAIGIPLLGSVLYGCAGIYYVKAEKKGNRLIVAKSEFWKIKDEKKSERSFILVQTELSQFPICLRKTEDDDYIAVLLKCTHRSCELNVGGGIYSCPCHGSEFSLNGKLLQGPAEKDLLTFKIETDETNVHILLS